MIINNYSYCSGQKKQNFLLPDESNNMMLLDTRKQNVWLNDVSNKIMFSDTGKQNTLLPGKSNKIMFMGTLKQNVLLPDGAIICFGTPRSKLFCFLTRAIR